MINIELLRVEESPLNHIGKVAGICYNSCITDSDKNVKRAKNSIISGHGKIMDFIDIEFVITGLSARTMRQLGRYQIGFTYLQESTRYVEYGNFEYYELKNPNKKVKDTYFFAMDTAKGVYQNLIKNGVNKEDAANVLPLGMNTKVVAKASLRMLIHMMEERLCTRAYKEFQEFCLILKQKLEEVSEEWKWISDNYFHSKCVRMGYCTELDCCGFRPHGIEGLKKKAVEEYLKENSK